jgi:hypothetical protein
MKVLVPSALVLVALVIAVPAAQAAPTSEGGCAVEHLSGAECQGPDADSDTNSCSISTWVGNATCELTVADGVASAANASASAYATVQGTDWHAEFHYVIRDKLTGQVLFSQDGSSTTPLVEASPVPFAGFTFGGALPLHGGGEVVCEVVGTHTPAGAAGSGAAASSGFGEWNNTFGCRVV